MKVTEGSALYQYLKKYQEDPHSRVFAPLAEAYRKAGLIDEAVEIAIEGLRRHPHYVGGKVALARAQFDKKNYQEVVETLDKVLADSPDNLVALRLVADSSLILGDLKRALECYKLILFYSPQDTEAAQVVWELETDSYVHQQKQTWKKKESAPIPSFGTQGTPEVRISKKSVHAWRQKIVTLQELLLKVERYRNQFSDPLTPA
jgi:tetratricopeptide (TPR) repeat protein